MKILGINGGTRAGYMDVAAALIIDGKVVAAIEEERLNRIKMSPAMISERSVIEVLRIAGISINDVDVIASHGSTWGDQYVNLLKGYFNSTFGYCPKIEIVHHHDAHAASAFFASGFDKAMILTIDDSGDGISTQSAIGENSSIKVINRVSRPNSLGIFYSLITQFCGFRREYDEYKLMGLSSYGNRDKYDFSWLLDCAEGKYNLNTDFVIGIAPGEPSPSRQEMFFNEKLIEKLGPKRLNGEPITEFYKDVAASAQKHLEDTLIELVTGLHGETGLRKLCLAGGVALNCVANQKLMNLDFVDEIFIQPAASDAGVSLGAAYLVAQKNGDIPQPTGNTYLGSEFSNEEIEETLVLLNTSYDTIENPARYAAVKIAENKIIGWFQGRSEFGPRALGNRSILANPQVAEMKDKINERIKFRESFRPFCPSVLEEDATVYFAGKSAVSPYMNITYDVLANAVDLIPAVTHIDQTSRIQTVNEKQNPLFYKLLTELKEITNLGVVLNTSFNVKGEPIVNSPRDAIATFYGSGLDCLVIGNYVVKKMDS